MHIYAGRALTLGAIQFGTQLETFILMLLLANKCPSLSSCRSVEMCQTSSTNPAM